MTGFHDTKADIQQTNGERCANLASGRAAALSARLAALPALDGVAHLAREFRGRIALVSSFGIESAVLLHLVAQADPAMPVLFLETGKLFPETLRYRDQLVREFGLKDVRSVTPDPADLAARDPRGNLWSADPDSCCAMRKVAPLARALAPFDIWMTGRKRFQGGLRTALPLVEATEDGRLRANPLARWSLADLGTYRHIHELPQHPLAAAGYASLGCMPCTTPVAAGEDPRAGRWRGSAKTECGIHLPALTRQRGAA